MLCGSAAVLNEIYAKADELIRRNTHEVMNEDGGKAGWPELAHRVGVYDALKNLSNSEPARASITSSRHLLVALQSRELESARPEQLV